MGTTEYGIADIFCMNIIVYNVYLYKMKDKLKKHIMRLIREVLNEENVKVKAAKIKSNTALLNLRKTEEDDVKKSLKGLEDKKKEITLGKTEDENIQNVDAEIKNRKKELNTAKLMTRAAQAQLQSSK